VTDNTFAVVTASVVIAGIAILLLIVFGPPV
jgi:hypothetical protein